MYEHLKKTLIKLLFTTSSFNELRIEKEERQ